MGTHNAFMNCVHFARYSALSNFNMLPNTKILKFENERSNVSNYVQCPFIISFDEVTNILPYSTLPKIVLLNFNEMMFHPERWIQLSLDFVLVPLYFVLSRFAVYYS